MKDRTIEGKNMRGFLGALPREMRVKQWTKNLLVYAAILFSGNLFQEQLFMLATIAFFACCFPFTIR